MPQTQRHKVFISYHHDEDQEYKDRFVEMVEEDFVDKSVEDGDIDDRNLSLDEVRRRIRDDFIADATVTVGADRPLHLEEKVCGLGDWFQSEEDQKESQMWPAGYLASQSPEF